MGKTIVITGAGLGLGRALARQFAGSGNRVILLGRTFSKVRAVAETLDGGAYAVECDVSSPESVRTAFAEIAGRDPAIDILVNNAAVYQPARVQDLTDEQIEHAARTNYAGPIYCARAALPMLRGGGHILNISSETVTMNHAMFALYQSSKAGLERFSRALHQELADSGIRVTMVRAGQMSDEDSRLDVDPEVGRRFAEDNLARGLDLRTRPRSTFASVATLFQTLIDLPADVNVPEIVIEAR